ncbi:transmembrane 220 family protein [Pontibacter ruber]|uniref:Transmembrane 220 family protein n=1 Tax=Pontibacter ruber TaxID=1343895 RepID=A0ABW5CSW4_9BACT|nr:transmembrane 220 family protein [Pontibacter ruber]
MKRVIGFILGLCFIVFAALQYNDPDAAVWVAVYLIAAAFCFLAAYGKASRPLLIIACVVAAAGAV